VRTIRVLLKNWRAALEYDKVKVATVSADEALISSCSAAAWAEDGSALPPNDEPLPHGFESGITPRWTHSVLPRSRNVSYFNLT